MLFLDKSTRTRNAFEAGMTQLGGHAHYLDADKTQVAHGESPKDMGIILSRYGEGLAIRHDLAPYEGNAWMREIAEWAEIPLINLQCDVDHPTQTLADLMTLRERLGESLQGLRVAVSWAFAPSYAKPLSVPQGLATLLPRFGVEVVLEHVGEATWQSSLQAARAGGRIVVCGATLRPFAVSRKSCVISTGPPSDAIVLLLPAKIRLETWPLSILAISCKRALRCA